MTVVTPRGLNQRAICSCVGKKLGQKVFTLEIWKYGLFIRTRWMMGIDIGANTGQLAV